MKTITPISKQSLPDSIAREIRKYIISRSFKQGDRLPSSSEMARLFQVGIPTLREAIKKLETIGSLDVKHGSGIFVGKYFYRLFLPNPAALFEPLHKDKLIELIDARIAIEGRVIHLALPNLTEEDLNLIQRLLNEASENLNDRESCALKYFEIENTMRKASNNIILVEMIHAITNLYSDEQVHIMNVRLDNDVDYQLHCNLLEALKTKNERAAIKVMEKRFKLMRQIIIKYID